MHVGELIKKYREDNHLSTRDFAKKSGISYSYISILERNKGRDGKALSPTYDTIVKTAGAMNLSVNEVMAILSKEKPAEYPNIGNLSNHEYNIITSYRKQSKAIQCAVDKLLDI